MTQNELREKYVKFLQGFGILLLESEIERRINNTIDKHSYLPFTKMMNIQMITTKTMKKTKMSLKKILRRCNNEKGKNKRNNN